MVSTFEWMNPEMEVPADPDEYVLAIVSGSLGGFKYDHGYELMTYSFSPYGNGWDSDRRLVGDVFTIEAWAHCPEPPYWVIMGDDE